MRLFCYPGLLFLICTGLAYQAEPVSPSGLSEQLIPLIQAHAGIVSVSVEHLSTGESFRFQADQPMPTASLIKLPIMVEAYRQAEQEGLDLNEKLTLKNKDKVPGSGILNYHFSEGAQFSIRDAIRLMIAYSDNTATNMIVERIGLTKTTALMQKMGLPETRLNSLLYRRDTSIEPARSKLYGIGSTTANEMVKLLGMLHRGELVNPESTAEMFKHLEECDDRKKLRSGLAAGIKIVHKSGSVEQVRTDAGIVYGPNGAFAIAVLTSENEDTSWGDSNSAERLCGKICGICYDYFNPLSDMESAETPLRPGSQGELVAALQRTLNSKMGPEAQITVDGEYGPATEAALRDFQTSNALPVTGIAEEETLVALGTLLAGPAQPETPIKPRDPLSGAPFVTAKAWGILDAKTGVILDSHEEQMPREMASITKMMTALVVAEMGKEHLDEQVTFSKRADNTTGTSSGIRAGEVLTVKELLYGLMLPSGNDAAIALAEHFGKGKNPIDQFVGQMNAKAKTLGMSKTKFANPHGLPAENQQTTIHDLALLSREFLQSPWLRDCAKTRRYEVKLTRPKGYTRMVEWENTNELLMIEGYQGIKTGTTNNAGACLISLGKRKRDELVVIVLGCSSSAARYADTRNLFRWGWQKLGHTE